MHHACSTQYRLSTLWRFNAPLDAVWDAIFRAEDWPRWWHGMERVSVLEPGDASGLGARRLYVCKSVLPYRLSFMACVTRIEPLCLLQGRVEGELEGVGCCRFTRAGALTTVRHDWWVRTTGRWMNRLSPLAKPLFQWNHDAIMHAGGIGLSRYLNEGAGPAQDMHP